MNSVSFLLNVIQQMRVASHLARRKLIHFIRLHQLNIRFTNPPDPNDASLFHQFPHRVDLCDYAFIQITHEHLESLCVSGAIPIRHLASEILQITIIHAFHFFDMMEECHAICVRQSDHHDLRIQFSQICENRICAVTAFITQVAEHLSMFTQNRERIDGMKYPFRTRVITDKFCQHTHLRWCRTYIPRCAFVKVKVEGWHNECSLLAEHRFKSINDNLRSSIHRAERFVRAVDEQRIAFFHTQLAQAFDQTFERQHIFLQNYITSLRAAIFAAKQSPLL